MHKNELENSNIFYVAKLRKFATLLENLRRVVYNYIA